MSPTNRPRSVEAWIGAVLEECPCGRRHRIPLERFLLGPGVLDNVEEGLPPAGGADGPLLLLADPETHDAAGARVAARLRGAGRRVEEAVLGTRPHAGEEALALLRQRRGEVSPSCIVAVGAGTLNDLGKVLASEAGLPLLTVATAASMNGYTSPIASLTLGGLKVTRPAPPARALVVDTEVLAAAPPELRAAGFGDLMSKPVSGADWVLAHELTGEPLCLTALTVADEAVARARARAQGVGRGEAAALGVLAEALLLSGVSMALAGASSPASGGEHLVSHFLDMSAEGWNRRPRLHGEQVAVATLACLALHEALLGGGPPVAGAEVPGDDTDGLVRDRLAHLGPRALESVLREAQAKRSRRPGRAQRMKTLRTRWEEIAGAVRRQLAGTAGLERDLRRAGAPTRFAGIEVSAERARALLVGARHLRDRYTVLDLAADLGRLAELAESVAERLAR